MNPLFLTDEEISKVLEDKNIGTEDEEIVFPEGWINSDWMEQWLKLSRGEINSSKS